jgi:C-terminal processing protease CtpA/Prc
LLCLTLAGPAAAQITRFNISSYLGFENGIPGAHPPGWLSTAGVVVDGQIAHSGKNSLRIDRDASSAGTFTTINLTLPLDFAAKNVVWSGWVRTENVNGAAAIWLREDGTTPSLAFATTQGLNVNGTQNWTQYSISVPELSDGKSLIFGFLLLGTGRAWVDDLQLLADGVPVAQAAPRVVTPLDTDHEFDSGSKINLTALTGLQVQNLATLARVWGFLKYHHPAVTGGKHHWDYDLFRVMPQVLAAGSRDAALSAISGWIGALEAPSACTTCATLDPNNLHLAPDLDWIYDESLLGRDLSQTLQGIYRNRTVASAQFYISLVPGVGNPSFDHELSYGSLRIPDLGYQLLALFRVWNMVQYFYPNRAIMSDDPSSSQDYWKQVLLDSIPRIGLAANSLSYQQELIRFIAKIHDTHANLWSSIAARPPIGTCYLPVDVRFVQGSPVILRYTSATGGPASGMMPGDVIQQLDGVAITDLVAQWTPLYADSNQAARLRDIGQYLTRGPCGKASLVVERGGQILNLTPTRMSTDALDFSATYTHDLPGDTFQMLTRDVAYLKLSSVKVADSAKYIQSAAGSKGLIIDIRNYPSEFVVFSLGALLISRPVDFVRFTQGDIANPSAFHWSPPLGITPQQPHYDGKVVILIDEITQSSAEYTTMALRTAPGALVIGSTTAGADGNVSTVLLPGGLSSYISGIGVFYPDQTPTQRVGIIPDIAVTPTIAGIRAGRDELIEEAIRQITRSWHRPPRRR